MDWRRFAMFGAVAVCGATLTMTSCGKKTAENNDDSNSSNGSTNSSTNGMPNNASNGVPNNGTIAPNNGTTGPNNGTNNNNTPEPAEFGLDERPANTTCVAFDRPPSGSNITTERAFPDLSFNDPVWLQQSPSAQDDRWFVIEQRGEIRTVANDDAAGVHEEFIDIATRVNSGGERGLLGMAFHPDWPTTPEVWLSYTRGNLESVVSKFTSADGGVSLDKDSEEIVLTEPQPYGNHNGGQIAFGPDGYLYFGLGDGGDGGDPLGHGQDTDTLHGNMLRIDVTTDPYSIPPDNPFAGGGGEPEIFAWGLRNPWRWSFDTETGDLWVGDVGQGNWEEIDLVEIGGNYGWNAKEGTHCFNQNPCDDGPWIDPIVEYDHSQGRRSVTGGYVYRGDAIPALRGVYIFGDYVSGHVYGIFENEQTGEPQMRELFQHSGRISSFGQSQDGEVYIVDYGGTLHRIIPDGDGDDSNFPRLLSETGCVDTTDPTQPAPGLVPYGVNAPFWSDGADKEGGRYLALPDGGQITIDESGDWSFPAGTVIVKNFELGGQLIETRLMVHHEDGDWAGYSYEWNDAGTDAVWAQGGKTKEIGGQAWSYPTSGDCLNCHTQSAGRTLGLENAQLDGDFVYTSTNRLSNQIDTLAHIGMFEEAPDPDAIEELADPFGSADLDARARAYLHTNCAQCHRSGADLRTTFDLTAIADPLVDDELCDAAPIGGDLGVEDAKRLVPGDADHSLIWLRMNRRDAQAMPPIGSNIVDEQGAELIREWIESLGACQL